MFDAAGFERHADRRVARGRRRTARRSSALIAVGGEEPPAPREAGRTIMLTSGTTGTPKGATRTVQARALPGLAIGGFLELSRFKPTPRSGEPILVAPPLFHLYGMIGFGAAFAFGSPMRDPPPVRPGGGARADRPPPRGRDPGRADDVQADHGPARGDAPQVRHLIAADGVHAAPRRCRPSSRRRSWTSGATSSTTATPRPRSGRARSRRPPTCAPRREPSGARWPASRSRSSMTRGSSCHRGRPAGSSSAARSSSTATPAAAPSR